MNQNGSEENPYSLPTENGIHPLVDPLRRKAVFLGWASFGCAMIFPVTFWGILFAEKNNILGKAIPSERYAVALFLVASSLSAVILGLFSLMRGLRKIALIGMIVGLAELLLMIACFSNV